MKLIDQIINTLQTIDLKKRVIEKTENEKGESIKVSIVDSGFLYKEYFDYDTMRVEESLYFNGDLVLSISMFKGYYDRKVIEETKDGFCTFKGLDWSTTIFKGMEDFLNVLKGNE